MKNPTLSGEKSLTKTGERKNLKAIEANGIRQKIHMTIMNHGALHIMEDVDHVGKMILHDGINTQSQNQPQKIISVKQFVH